MGLGFLKKCFLGCEWEHGVGAVRSETPRGLAPFLTGPIGPFPTPALPPWSILGDGGPGRDQPFPRVSGPTALHNQPGPVLINDCSSKAVRPPGSQESLIPAPPLSPGGL